MLAGAFLAVQLFLILVVGYGPFRDEAFYVTSGLQLWSGDAYPRDRYLHWFNGSPYMWPALAGAAYLVGGLAGARIVALACFGVALSLAHSATRTLLGPAAALGAVAVILLQGSSLILAHYATYDLGAFPLLAAALWCIVRGSRAGAGIGWVVAAGLALWLAALTKYAYALTGLPLALLAWSLRGERRTRDVGLFAAAAGLPFLLSMQTLFGTWIPPTLGNYDHATFPSPAVAVGVGAFVAVPLALTLYGLRHPQRGERRTRALLHVGVVSLLLWPLFHAASGQIASAFKHSWAGVLVAAPAVGFGAERAWRAAGPRLRAAGLAALAAVGLVQWVVLEPMTYPNFAPSVDFVLDGVPRGDRVYVVGDNDRWVYAMYLYAEGRVESPFAVVDQGPDELATTCAYEWVVSTRTGVTGDVRAAGWMCPYEVVFERRQRFLNYRGDLDTQTFRVYRRSAGVEPEASRAPR